MLADRQLVIRQNVAQVYPVTRKTQLSYTGSGYGAGYAEGQKADIGSARVRAGGPRAQRYAVAGAPGRSRRDGHRPGSAGG